MIDTGYFKDIEKLPNPRDYFRGCGEEHFSLPNNILMFYRGNFSGMELHLYTDFHYRHVLIFNFGNPIRILVDGKQVYLQNQSFTLLMPYQYHRYINEKQTTLSLIFLTFEMTDNLFLEPLRNMPCEFDDRAAEILKEGLNLFRENRTVELPFWIGALLAHLSTKEPVLPDIQYRNIRSSRLVSEICRHLYHNKALTIQELSTNMGYSESYLRKTFRKVMGIALGQYIIEIRLTDAMKYLSTTDKTVSEITELVGYENIYSLSRSFKVHLGLSPTAYRNERKKHLKKQEAYRFRNRKRQDRETQRVIPPLSHYFSSDYPEPPLPE